MLDGFRFVDNVSLSQDNANLKIFRKLHEVSNQLFNSDSGKATAVVLSAMITRKVELLRFSCFERVIKLAFIS